MVCSIYYFSDVDVCYCKVDILFVVPNIYCVCACVVYGGGKGVSCVKYLLVVNPPPWKDAKVKHILWLNLDNLLSRYRISSGVVQILAAVHLLWSCTPKLSQALLHERTAINSGFKMRDWSVKQKSKRD